jgi:ABC-2 type transport system permease protein
MPSILKTLLRISWLNLKRDYAALALSFVLPIVLFTIFSLIFGRMSFGGGGDAPKIKLLALDLDKSSVSRRLLESLGKQTALRVEYYERISEATSDETTDPREKAVELVRKGKYSAALIVPPGWSGKIKLLPPGAPSVELIYDAANPMAQYTVSGLLQASAMSAIPDVLSDAAYKWLDSSGIKTTTGQRKALNNLLAEFALGKSSGDSEGDSAADDKKTADKATPGLLPVKATAARSVSNDNHPSSASSINSYYAAGIGVMFLLFSMVNAGGSLLQEEEAGTLERLLNANVSMRALLAGKWLFYAIEGVIQLTLMFVWGALVFGVDLWSVKHLCGFFAMTLPTAAAAAAFGIVLATAARSWAQLNGLSTMLILIMSAVGGSMVPRFLMPAFMDTLSLFTFNGWALDGYLKVFWYEDPNAGLWGFLASLLPQVGVISGMTVVFLLIARLLARRWETV